MKGLMVKDYLLMKNQKKFFLILLGIAFVMAISGLDITFVTAYVAFLVANSSLSTISYDDYENASSYLFSLPITRGEYVKEKYVFTLLNAFVSWLASILLTWGYMAVKHQQMEMKTVWMSSGLCFVCVVLFIAICLPLWLKFGPEKGRMTIFMIAAGIALVMFLISNVLKDKLKLPALAEVLNRLDERIEWFLLGLLLLLIVVLLGSFLISLRVVKNKEF